MDKNTVYYNPLPKVPDYAMFYGLCTAKTVNAYWGASKGIDHVGYSDNYDGTYTYYMFNDNHWFQWWDRFVWINSKDVIDFHINSKITESFSTNNNRFGDGAPIQNYDFGNAKIQTNNLKETFYNAPKLQKIGIRNWDLSRCTSLYAMAANNVSGIFSAENITALREVNMPDTMKTPSCTQVHKMFAWNRGLKKITGMKSLDFSAVTNFSEMFCENHSLESVEFSVDNWVTSACTYIHSMFLQCFRLDLGTLGDFKTWDVSNVTDFSGCFGRTSTSNIDISGWNMSSATNIDNMFTNTDIYEILDNGKYIVNYDLGFRTINLSGIQLTPSSITNHYKVFKDCNHLESINLSGCTEDVINFIKEQLVTDIPDRIKSEEFTLILSDGNQRYNGTEWITVS